MDGQLIQNRDRWLAITVLIGIIGVFYMVAVMPLLSIANGYQESIDDLEFKLQRYKRIASQKNSVLKRVAEIKKKQASNNNFIVRKTNALASADLQKLIKSAVSSAGGGLTSTQVLPGREENGVVRIGIKVRMSGNMQVLKSVLHRLESERPMLIIDKLNIRSVKSRRRDKKTRKLVSSSKLNVDFEVVGYMRE